MPAHLGRSKPHRQVASKLSEALAGIPSFQPSCEEGVSVPEGPKGAGARALQTEEDFFSTSIETEKKILPCLESTVAVILWLVGGILIKELAGSGVNIPRCNFSFVRQGGKLSHALSPFVCLVRVFIANCELS
eukprot:gnl/TRDRNA2_/TRDRNA2_168413_c2_seq5.p1 gnl/TRDRNA2_/TRDRNA2_168413_c2~~gnl/TRDRNA2_/TRDRNA2_168413_c2_seq5.p1  ORF type:complete len:133 (+),score=5.55 gnl/TRDRNA2_/TRDRNA2_168413_c2_seq5:350-748(+)